MVDQSKDPPKEDQDWEASDAEVQKQVQTLHLRIRKLCHYQHTEQRLSAQIITGVLADILSEVSGVWWGIEFEELLEDLEKQYPADGSSEDDPEDDAD